MITIVNYGLGNVLAFQNIYKRLGIPVKEARTAGDLIGSTRLILPGVGSFDWAVTRLNKSGMRPLLEKLVLEGGAPVLGVCVGMQLLAEESEEGKLKGLGWIEGCVRRFPRHFSDGALWLPQMGWNNVVPRGHSTLFANLEECARFYFLHSYYFIPRNSENILGDTEYGFRYASAVGSGKILGVQFHPEKSHRYGVELLRRFASV
jgi:glutamine amidotransferase